MPLKAGRYQNQHRVDGADHFVHFTELTKGPPHLSGGRVTKVLSRGKNVAHVF